MNLTRKREKKKGRERERRRERVRARSVVPLPSGNRLYTGRLESPHRLYIPTCASGLLAIIHIINEISLQNIHVFVV